MNNLEHRNVQELAKSNLITEDERAYLKYVLSDFGWKHPLTDAVITEISKIRAEAGKSRS